MTRDRHRLAFVDLSTGEFRATEFVGERPARLPMSWNSAAARDSASAARDATFRWRASADLNGLVAVRIRGSYDCGLESSYATRTLKEQFRVAGSTGSG